MPCALIQWQAALVAEIVFCYNRKLEKDLLRFACRHNIFELILASVFNESISVATSGPDIATFKRFQQLWKYVDQSNYKTGIDNEEVARSTQNDRDDLISA